MTKNICAFITQSGKPCQNSIKSGSVNCSAGHPVPNPPVQIPKQDTIDIEPMATIGIESLLVEEVDPSYMYENGKIVYDEYGYPVECLESHKGSCSGGVKYLNNPYSDSFTAFPRCITHAERWLDEMEDMNSHYPNSDIAPDWFDSNTIGELWSED